MDVGAGKGYPASALSNFSAHPFELDGVKCASMEGFLQSLKFKTCDLQAEVCTLIGKKAKFRGKGKNWHRTQTLYWRGVEYKRSGKPYQNLLDRAYNAMFVQAEGFKNALLAAGKDAVFKHSIGRNSATETVLTQTEFCSRLMILKRRAFEEQEASKK